MVVGRVFFKKKRKRVVKGMIVTLVGSSVFKKRRMVLMPLLSRLLTLLVILSIPLFLGLLTLIPIKSLSIVFSVNGEAVTSILKLPGVQTVPILISSRRRHTRSDRDWSSDVCSSD